MSGADRFLDTNVLLYLLSGDEARAGRAEAEVGAGGVISVQVLNEFASVASRKLGMSTSEICEVLAAIRSACSVVPLNEDTHDLGLSIAERYGLCVYDSMIAASAVLAGCNTLLTEDLQDGQTLEAGLRVRNPFP